MIDRDTAEVIKQHKRKMQWLAAEREKLAETHSSEDTNSGTELSSKYRSILPPAHQINEKKFKSVKT